MPGAINWRTDPSSNDVSDPPILFNEGQPAKTINDAMRALMASWALWNLDNLGIVKAFGAGDYVALTNQVLTDRAAGQPHGFAFLTSTTNLTPCTLSFDGRPKKRWLRADGTEFGPLDIHPCIWRVVYDPEIDAYRTVSPHTPPAGLIIACGGTTAPPGFEICDGRPVSRTSYVTLFSRIGVTWGPGDGETTFNLPDLRGRALFGRNDGTSRLTGAGGLVGTIGTVGGSEAVALLQPQMPSHVHTAQLGYAGAHGHEMYLAGQHNHGGASGAAGGHSHTGTALAAGSHSHTGGTDTGGEHAHLSKYAKVQVNTNTPLNGAVVGDLFTGGAFNATGQTDSNGQHFHSIATNVVPDHTHTVSTIAVSDHQHIIPIEPGHTHPLATVPDHTHTLTINAAGSGDPHPNVPPGAVVMWAIKT